ncbi:hypothetical protein [Sphingomonas piscis]|uniref:hypothetical protein n=1 Tax=Sphingomonas piscis TaxID=2714943 RepID=UPI001FEB8C13|nr:hypothetical protein [Sphingomonas piscis]
MRKRIARLFTIKTKWEAWFVIYAIALGAIERGRHYMEVYPGFSGYLLAFACTGVVFLAGGKLLDSVTPAKPAMAFGPHVGDLRRRYPVSRSRPKVRHAPSGSTSPISLRKD